MGLKLYKEYCSYIPALVKALNTVDGAVLEMGSGIYSTPFLHWLCFDSQRELVTYESDKQFYDMAKQCESDFHKVHLVSDWDDAKIERGWAVALVDHAPTIRRKDDIRRLADFARCLVVHDTQGRSNKHYHYDEIYPLFKYRRGYGRGVLPQTIVLSNYIDVTSWF